VEATRVEPQKLLNENKKPARIARAGIIRLGDTTAKPKSSPVMSP
jgi:hypothetical protein